MSDLLLDSLIVLASTLLTKYRPSPPVSVPKSDVPKTVDVDVIPVCLFVDVDSTFSGV